MSKQPYERVNWESGTLVTPAKVLADNTIQDAVYDCDTPLTPENLNKMDSGIKTLDDNKIEIIELLTVSDTAPTECATGDMYYNTTTNKIYTATNTDTWGETGTDPESNNLYIDLENTNIYYYDGTSFKSYGGGSGSGGAGDTEPIGSTKMYFGTTEPTGYKFVNGQALSRTEYAELFNLIGTTYGAGDESTTFNLPDMSGRVPVGLNVNKEWFNQLGKTGGSEEVTLTVEQMPNHNHIIGYDVRKNAETFTDSYSLGTTSGGDIKENSIPTTYVGGGQAHTNLQPYITVNYIMKVKNITSTPETSNVIGASDTPNDKDVYSSNAVKEMFDNANNDTGWIDLPLKNNWAALGGNYATPQYRKINNQVFIRGLINNGTNTQIAQLPEGFRPLKTIYGVYVTDDTTKAVLIEKSGSIHLQNYISSSWSALNISFFID